MLFTIFETYGCWINKEQGQFIPLKLFGTTVCHGSSCELCHGKRFIKRNGEMSGGSMYVSRDEFSCDARHVICRKCADKHLFKVGNKPYVMGNGYYVQRFANKLSDITKPE